MMLWKKRNVDLEIWDLKTSNLYFDLIKQWKFIMIFVQVLSVHVFFLFAGKKTILCKACHPVAAA